MEFSQFLDLINKKKQTIAVVTILFVLFAVLFTFVQPLRFSAQSKVLVMQALPDGVDPYQISRSNENVASLLTQIISTNSFYNEVINSGFNINKKYFPDQGNKLMKLWKKTVKASSDPNGIISIKIYHNNRVQVSEIAQAVNYILETKHGQYHGFGKSVSIKVIEQPVTSDLPVKPNIFINMSVAFAFGILLSITYIYLFPEKKYNLHLLQKENLTLASDEIVPGKDDFEIYEPAPSYQAAAVEQDEDQLVYEKLRKAMSPPRDLPVIDEIDEPDEENAYIENLPEPKPIEIERRGSMENILKRPSQKE